MAEGRQVMAGESGSREGSREEEWAFKALPSEHLLQLGFPAPTSHLAIAHQWTNPVKNIVPNDLLTSQ